MASRSKWLNCAWIAHRLDLVLSPSWRLAPVPLRRLIERLEIEHMRHAGTLNGHLYVSYSQFAEAEISRRKISAILVLGEQLGLIEVVHAAEPMGDLRAAHSYRLTFLPAKGSTKPTDDWRRVSEARAKALVDAFHGLERPRLKARRRAA